MSMRLGFKKILTLQDIENQHIKIKYKKPDFPFFYHFVKNFIAFVNK